jgi:hypothetical protein
MNNKQGLLSGGWGKVGRNKRYIVWFYLLNLALATFGTAAFSNQAHTILDHSFYSDRLVHGFSMGVLAEMFARPELGPMSASGASAMEFTLLFFVLTALFLPGVFLGYASTYRLPREDFFRACGRNLWRFIRLLIVAGIVFGIVAGVLFAIRAGMLKAAGESTNEKLSFYISIGSLAVIFLVMSVLRIWFDLAETDVVLSDQRAVRKSIGRGLRFMFQNFGRLLGSYLMTTIVAAILLAGGIWAWMNFVPSTSVLGAIFITQLTLFLLLIPRFWQRGVAVTYYQQNMVEPIAVQSFTSVAVVAPLSAPAVAPVNEPAAEAAVPGAPESQAS